MRPMTNREQALMAYFYAVSTDPKVRAAGWDVVRLKDALLGCIAEDFPAVGRLALGAAATKLEEPTRAATKSVMGTVLGGTVSQKAAEEIAAGVETMVKDWFREFGDWLAKSRQETPQNGKK